MCKSIHFSIYIRKPYVFFFPTIGDDGSRQAPSDAASFVRVFWKSVLFFVMKKTCNGKTKGLAIQYIFHCFFENSTEIWIQYIFHCFFENSTEICIQYIFHDCLNLHKENSLVFFHYWRSQEPPVGHSCGEFRSSFLKKCIVFRNEKILQR